MNPPSRAGETPATRAGAVLLLAALAGLLGVSLLWNLGHPLLWNDEAETVAYGQRILVFGYPKISDGHNWVFALDAPLSLGRLPGSDAYVGSVWGQYYVAALGVLAARGVDDLYARTACFRLPFVLAGVAGLAATAAALAAVRRGHRPGALATVSGFLALCLLSVSLALHLREARYHGLAVGLQGLLLWLHVRGNLLRRSPGATALAIPLLLLALLNVFPPLALAWGGALGLDLAQAAWREAPHEARWRRLARELAPLTAAGLVGIACLRFYRLARLSRYFDVVFGGGLERRLMNASAALDFLGGHEPLLAALVVKVAWELARRRRGVGGGLAGRLSRLLGGVIVLQLGVALRLPFFFERYLIPAVPLIAASLALDAALLLELARGLAPRARRLAWSAGSALVALALLPILPAKRVEIEGHLAELRRPVRGTLDFVIPRLLSLRADPSTLVVATNYEDPAYVVYLGCRVLVGYTGAFLASDLAAEPDVIVARKGVGRHYADLAALWSRGRFVRERFPVRDLGFNNVPELTAGAGLRVTHQFRTPQPNGPDEEAELWRRIDEGS